MNSNSPKKVAADSSVLICALLSGDELKVLTHPNVEVLVKKSQMEEIRKFIPKLSSLIGVSESLLQLQLKLLPVTCLPDIQLAARILSQHVTRWTYEDDIQVLPLTTQTTDQLLRDLL